jgi:anti-sigma28 factor (negative regulator of flagellin synthesis)
VDVDGRKYYSTSTDAATNGLRQFVINDLSIGSHQIAVYDNSSNEELYSKTFQLRTDYDMIIAIRKTGDVTFTEKKMKASTQSSQTAMAETQFNSLLSSIKSKWSQSSRISAIKTAINTRSYYFTTEQVGNMLQLVNIETRRLELAKLAYDKVTDPLSYTEIADLLNTQTNKDNFIAYVQTKNPDIIASGQVSSSGQYASRIAMSETEFNKLHNKAMLHFRQSSVVTEVKTALSNTNNYFTLDQIRSLLSLISTEANRLALMKLAYHRATDPANFAQLYDLFNTQASINEINTYIRNTPS